MKPKQITISLEEIQDFMYEELTYLGFVVGEAELEAVSEIAFDYFYMCLSELEEEND